MAEHIDEEFMISLVRRGRWSEVRELLEKDGSDSQRRWAVEEACKWADDYDFFNKFLPFCREEDMDTVLSLRNSVIYIPWFDPKKMYESMLVAFVLYNIGTGNNPLLLNYRLLYDCNDRAVQYSVFQIAVHNQHCPQRMVAACIRLGLSTHQPQLTDHCNDVFQMKRGKFWYRWFPCLLSGRCYHDESTPPRDTCTSPFLSALLRGLPEVSTMLYESGTCSYAELFALYTFFQDEFETVMSVIEDAMPPARRFNVRKHLDQLPVSKLEKFLPCLKDMATTPRSLMSTCRLVISHSLNIRGNRQGHVQKLPLRNNKMRNYLMLSDVTHEEYTFYA